MRLSYSGLVCLPSKEDTVSSNLISRSTVNAFTKSFLLQLILDTHIGYLGSFFCYIWKFLPYTGNSSVAWYVRLGGGVDYSSGIFNFFYERRSPEPFREEVAILVYPSGDNGNYNGNSYIYRSYGHLFDGLFQISFKIIGG